MNKKGILVIVYYVVMKEARKLQQERFLTPLFTVFHLREIREIFWMKFQIHKRLLQR